MKIKDSCEPISAKKNQLRKKIKIEIAEFIKNQELYEKLSIQAQKHFLNTQASAKPESFCIYFIKNRNFDKSYFAQSPETRQKSCCS